MTTEAMVPQARPTRRLHRAVWPFGSGTWLIFLVAALPATLFYFRVVDSYSPGTALVVLAALSQRWVTGSLPARCAGSGNAPLLVCVGIAGHLILTSSFQPVDSVRAVSSLVFLLLLLLGSSSLATLLCRIPEKLFRQDLRKLGVLMLVVALLGLIGLAPPPVSGNPWQRSFFPFAEPAGFALPLAPVLMYLCVTAKGLQRASLLAIAVMGLALLKTLTLAVAIALIAAVSLKKSRLLAFAVVIGVLLTQADLSYYTERLDFGAEGNTNLSNLVYVQGWQLLLEGLERSQYLGQGFQQLGVQGTDVEAARIINALLQGADLNLLDGGFLLVKLGAEFGAFGLAVAAMATVQSLRSILVLRRVATNQIRMPAVVVFAHATMVALLLHLYVRSGGYFTGEVFLVLTAVWILARHRTMHHNRDVLRRGRRAGPSPASPQESAPHA